MGRPERGGIDLNVQRHLGEGRIELDLAVCEKTRVDIRVIIVEVVRSAVAVGGKAPLFAPNLPASCSAPACYASW
jgi:hypothetical protein